MFSRLKHVIKEKNALQKEIKRRRKRDIAEMRDESMFNAKLNRDLDLISILLLDSNIEKIEVETSQDNVSRLDRAIYGYEMAEYNVIKNDTSYILSNKELYL